MTHQPPIHPQPSAASAVHGQATPVRAPKRLRLAPSGPVSLLTADARPEVLAHLLRLSDDDLRMRFLRCMTAASIEAHVASLDFDTAIRLGIRRQGRLVAMVEGFIFVEHGETTMEVAFSTDPAWRRRGLAQALGHAIDEIATRRGVVRIVANCDARNVPMKSLLEAFDAEIEREDGELSATWNPAVLPDATDFKFEHFVHTTEEQTAQRLFATLPLGAAYAHRLVQALATGLLVATIESACIAEMQCHLADGDTVVGANVAVRHLGPALPGHGLRIRGMWRWQDGRRRAAFDVTVDDGHDNVATASVVMAVVGAARFAAGLARRHESIVRLAA
ncbi:MAG: GNAT family N-acetyltransferase [Caldimonas sp.]